jgi:hypothetical protein
MYISDITHYFDETGNIPKEKSKEARELARFLALVVNTTTKTFHATFKIAEVRCFESGCHGLIKTALILENEGIHWYCPRCHIEGIINGWRGTKWDNRNLRQHFSTKGGTYRLAAFLHVLRSTPHASWSI